MKELRQLLKEIFKNYNIKDKYALLFSGGTDSLTLFWTLLDLEIPFKCYTFKLENIDSNDYKVSQKICQHWNIEQQIISIKHDSLNQLFKELHTVIKIIQSYRKTHVEVMWGYWHLIKNIKEEIIISGLQADTLYGSSKSMAIKCTKDKEIFDNIRKKYIYNPDQEGFLQALKLCKFYKKELIVPYTDNIIRKFMLQFSWNELNKPKQKMPTILSFENEFKQIPIYRKNDNMQCGSGIREYIERILTNPILNKNKHKRVNELYKEIYYER